MKTLFTTLLIAALAMMASAQEQTLIGPNARVTGFGGPAVYYTSFNGEAHVLVGGAGAVLLNSKYYLGLAGYGVASEPDAGLRRLDGELRDATYEAGYFGCLVGTIFNSNDIIHTAADVTIGGGSVNLVRDDRKYHHEDEHEGWGYHAEDDAFFLVQPMAHLELNIIRWMRVDASAGYRLVAGISRFGLDDNDVNGPVAGLGIRFGKF